MDAAESLDLELVLVIGFDSWGKNLVYDHIDLILFAYFEIDVIHPISHHLLSNVNVHFHGHFRFHLVKGILIHGCKQVDLVAH